MTTKSELFFQLNSIPSEVKAFLKKALLVFVIWKVLYHLLLLPVAFPDKQLTYLTAESTASIYQIILKSPVILKANLAKDGLMMMLYIQNKKIIGIADGCNGLELFILYLGFLLCIPVSFRRFLIFFLFGTIAIFALNILRCVGLAYMYMNNYSFADFAHHYVFKMVIYGVIFFTWVFYSRRYFENAG